MKKFTFLLFTLFVIQALIFGQQDVKANVSHTVLLSKDSSMLYASSAAPQCLGTTKKGLRCKNKTLNISGYCYLHEDQNPEKGKSAPIKEVKSEKSSTTVIPSPDNSTPIKEVKSEKQTGTTTSGQPIYTGPRGGQFHYSKSGNKVYEKKK